MNKLVPSVRSVKNREYNFTCETCGLDFAVNPSIRHNYSVGRGSRKGVLLQRSLCFCSCGGIELELDDGTIGAIAHREDCPRQACGLRAYEAQKAMELAALAAIAEREAWGWGL